MKHVILALTIVALPGAAAAAPCVPGPLSSYVALGATGCSVGTAFFSHFDTLPPTGSETGIPAADVSVVPLDVPYVPGLRFEVDASAAAGEILRALIAYRASGTAFTGNRLSMAGTAVEPDGAVTVVENTCLGGIFASGLSGCSGVGDLLAVFDIGVDSDLEEVLAFGPVALIGIVNDIVIDGGLAGSARLGSATNELTAVPEPATATLLVIGAAAICARRRRSTGSPLR